MTVGDMPSKLPSNDGTLVRDRGKVSPSHVADAAALDRKLTRGMPKCLKSVRPLLDSTDV